MQPTGWAALEGCVCQGCVPLPLQGKALWLGTEQVKLQPLPATGQPCQEPDRLSMINAEVKPFHQLPP